MISLASWALAAALGASILTFLLGVVATATRERRYHEAAIRGMVVTAFFTTVASAGLIYAFVVGDFSLQYVWAHSDRDMPVLYKIGGFWGGQEGSLLFWALILSWMGMAMVLWYRRERTELMAPATATVQLVNLFFLVVVTFVANPFERVPGFVPPDGRGLNPLLQHPAMLLHPPTLYLGFVGMTLPFALAMGALISGRLDDEWIKKGRLWTILAWIFLGAGIVLGGRWAYVELGWGGYWAWDPVENASFMPWLASTALLHSVMMQERKGMLKVWNMVLVIVTFLLTIFGTFITRSGLVSSVHSFAQSPVGTWFAGFLAFIIVASFGLLIYRLPRLRSENRLDAFLSRESFFVINNLVLLVGAFAVLWGTIFPMISEAVRGQRISVGPPFFNRIMTPLGLLLLFLVGAGPLIPWRRATAASLWRLFRWPLVLGILSGVALRVVGSHGWALATQVVSIFVGVTIVQEFWRGIRARRRNLGEGFLKALWGLFVKNRRRYGGYLVHAGVVLAFLGFSGNAFVTEAKDALEPGQTLTVGPYTLTYLGLEEFKRPGLERVSAQLLLSRDGEPLTLMLPQKNWYEKSEQLASEVSIYSTLKEDVYAVFAGFEGQKASIKVFINPLVQLFWLGGLLTVLGGVIAILPGPKRRRRE
jgi:cytochrome c-type biogenesis protein CcmF